MARGRKAPRKTVRGGRTRPAPKGGGGRKLQAGGHGHGDYQTVGQTGPIDYHQHWVTQTSASMGTHQHPSGLPRPPRPGGVIPGRRRGGKVTYKLRSSGRTRPAPKRMATGGRTNTAPARKMPHGGTAGGMGCKMLTGQIDCDASSGCNWDYDGSSCY